MKTVPKPTTARQRSSKRPSAFVGAQRFRRIKGLRLIAQIADPAQHGMRREPRTRCQSTASLPVERLRRASLTPASARHPGFDLGDAIGAARAL